METIEGFVDHIIFQNPDIGYTVLELTVDSGDCVLVGMLKGVSQGDTIQAEGEYTEHPVYGTQFKASDIGRFCQRMRRAWSVIWHPEPLKASVWRWRKEL